jgi:hypothetical protein
MDNEVRTYIHNVVIPHMINQWKNMKTERDEAMDKATSLNNQMTALKAIYDQMLVDVPEPD